MRLLLTAAGAADLIGIARRLAQASGSKAIGTSFSRELREQCEKLAKLPGTLGRERPDLGPRLRSFPFKGYVVIFRYGDDIFEVARILSGRMNIADLFD